MEKSTDDLGGVRDEVRQFFLKKLQIDCPGVLIFWQELALFYPSSLKKRVD
ncbi:MAG: hypothetical protein H7Y12_06915 [Sphingobacteriaceae bacterium]|nr:hypothetical protein [Cytophagaceae bacterium]